LDERQDVRLLVRVRFHRFSAGHMGVEGTVGARRHDYTASSRVAVLDFDPSQLPALVHDARVIAGQLP
jgi:hypothetical protein